MAGLPSPMVEFRELLVRTVRELEDERFEANSPEWYFLRYVRRLRNTAEKQESAADCSPAMQGLTRYFVDSIDEKSDLGDRFREILECHRFALRTGPNR